MQSAAGKLSCNKTALKRCTKTEILWNIIIIIKVLNYGKSKRDQLRCGDGARQATLARSLPRLVYLSRRSAKPGIGNSPIAYTFCMARQTQANHTIINSYIKLLYDCPNRPHYESCPSVPHVLLTRKQNKRRHQLLWWSKPQNVTKEKAFLEGLTSSLANLVITSISTSSSMIFPSSISCVSSPINV